MLLLLSLLFCYDIIVAVCESLTLEEYRLYKGDVQSIIIHVPVELNMFWSSTMQYVNCVDCTRLGTSGFLIILLNRRPN